MSTPAIAVVGAGWAGIAAAVALVNAGKRVVLFEAGPQPGGRARTAPALGVDVDNGQHIAIGAYSATLDLLATLGIPSERVFARYGVRLDQIGPDGPRISLRASKGAGRLQLAFAFLSAKGLSSKDKFAIIRHWSRLMEAPPEEATVSDWLSDSRQPAAAINLLWNPLCIATLNTLPEQASAKVFGRVLREAFGAGTRGAADLLLPASDLGSVMPGPAVEWLARRGAEICLGERVTGLAMGSEITAVTTTRNAHPVSAAILAVPPDACARLVQPFAAFAGLLEHCEQFATQPICTIYLRYAETASLEFPLLGLHGTTTQWLVDRRVAGQPGIIAAIISAEGPHMNLDNDALVALVTQEIGDCVPSLGEPSDARVIREKRATFAVTPAIEPLRPSTRTACANLLLAGDWTATDLPPTLEGAVRSGYAAAAELI